MWQRFFLLLTLLLLLPVSSQAAALTGRVLWVYDGDTLMIENIGKVRLLGIDTPEYQTSSRDRYYTEKFQLETDRLRQISGLAKKHNIRNSKGTKVRLEFDKVRKDKHDRLLAYVYLPDGTMLNLALLEKGLATVFRRYDFKYKKDFLKAEKKAQKKGLGLWEK